MVAADDGLPTPPGWERVADTAAFVLMAGSRTIPVRALLLGPQQSAGGHRYRPVHVVLPALATPLAAANELTVYDTGGRRIVAAFIPLAIYQLAGDGSEVHVDGRMVTGLVE